MAAQLDQLLSADGMACDEGIDMLKACAKQLEISEVEWATWEPFADGFLCP
jgi:hypothetical protein